MYRYLVYKASIELTEIDSIQVPKLQIDHKVDASQMVMFNLA